MADLVGYAPTTLRLTGERSSD